MMNKVKPVCSRTVSTNPHLVAGSWRYPAGMIIEREEGPSPFWRAYPALNPAREEDPG